MDVPPDDFKARVDELERARRQLRQSVDASGIGLRRALQVNDDAPPMRAAETEGSDRVERWPLAVRASSRSHSHIRIILVLVLTVIVLAGAAVLRRRPVPEAIAGESSSPGPVVASIPEAPTGEPFVVHVSAIRPCLARVVVDGTALDWRQLKEGDEFVSRPVHDILIDTNDAGALAATINGQSVRLGDDGATVAFRLNSQTVRKFLEP